MSLLEWKEGFSVGVKELDLHHQKIFDLVNQLHQIMRNLKDKEFIIPVVEELKGYGGYHLNTEEKYFDAYGYTGAKDHKKAHEYYRQKIESFSNRLNDNFLSFELIDFLEDWWLGHITGEDQKYKDFFKKNGLK